MSASKFMMRNQSTACNFDKLYDPLQRDLRSDVVFDIQINIGYIKCTWNMNLFQVMTNLTNIFLRKMNTVTNEARKFGSRNTNTSPNRLLIIQKQIFGQMFYYGESNTATRSVGSSQRNTIRMCDLKGKQSKKKIRFTTREMLRSPSLSRTGNYISGRQDGKSGDDSLSWPRNKEFIVYLSDSPD